jgi:hypothetical protein
MALLDSYTPLGSFPYMEDPDAPGPCSCCWPTNALWHRGGGTVWVCGLQGGYWVELPPEEPTAAAEYAEYLAARVEETASLRRLAAVQYAAHSMRQLGSWAYNDEMDEAKRLATLSAEQRAQERAARDAAAAAQMADLNRNAEVSAVSRAAEAYAFRVARIVEVRAPRGPPPPRGAPPRGAPPRGPPKRPCPCKNLFYDEKQVRPGQRAPFVKYVASECWAHAYTDPKTGEKKAPHKCPYLHPGEVGWLPQWNRDRDFKARPAAPAAPAPRGGAAAGGGPRKPASRWDFNDEDD